MAVLTWVLVAGALLCLLLACQPTYYAIVDPSVEGAGGCVRECQSIYNDCIGSGRGGCSKQQYTCFQTCPGVVTNTEGCDEAPITGPCVQYQEGSVN